MKKLLQAVLILVVVISVAAPVHAGRWHRLGRKMGFGWSDGYHAPRGAYGGSQQWFGFTEPPVTWAPAVQLPAEPSTELLPVPRERGPRSIHSTPLNFRRPAPIGY